MPPVAPMHVPVEILRQGERTRWFRVTTGVSVDALSLAHLVPDELDGPLAVAFVLPGDGAPIRCVARAVEEVVGEGEDEHAERRALMFVGLDDAARNRINQYVTERLGLI